LLSQKNYLMAKRWFDIFLTPNIGI